MKFVCFQSYRFVYVLRSPPITSLGMSTGKFEDQSNNITSSIRNFFSQSVASTQNDNGSTGEHGLVETPQKYPDTDSQTAKSSMETSTHRSDASFGKKRKSDSIMDCFRQVAENNALLADSSECFSDVNNKRTCVDNDGATENNVSTEETMRETANNDPRSCALTVNASQSPKGFFAKLERRRSMAVNAAAAAAAAEHVTGAKYECTLDSNVIASGGDISRATASTSYAIATTLPAERENSPEPMLYDAEDYIQCDKCDKSIVVWEMPEHSDYHFALELQKEVPQTSVQARITPLPLTNKGRGKKKVPPASTVPSVRNYFAKM